MSHSNLTHGARCVAWSLEHDLVRENPVGSNRGPEISEWLRPCQRDGYGLELGEHLAKHGANWCAAFACAADRATRLEGDPPSVHGYRASGIELENDAKAVGAWRDAALVLDGSWEPAEGDLAIWQSGDGTAGQAWRRHVARYIQRHYAPLQNPPRTVFDTFDTIAGNEGNSVRITSSRRFDNPMLLGFIELPRVKVCDACGKPATCAHEYGPDANVTYGCLACCGHTESEREPCCRPVAAEDPIKEAVSIEVLKRAVELEKRLWTGVVGMDAFDELLRELEATDPREW